MGVGLSDAPIFGYERLVMDSSLPRPLLSSYSPATWKLMGIFYSRLGKCRECNHSTSDLSHDLCRSHAFCARGFQYYGAVCSTCDDLWYRARDFSDSEDAIRALDLLSDWIRGFRKNSKGRPAGQDHFYDPREKIQLQELHALVANLRSEWFPLWL